MDVDSKPCERLKSEVELREIALLAESQIPADHPDPERARAAYVEQIRASQQQSRTLIKALGGIPRLERGWAPVNPESNDLYQFRMSSVYYEKHREKRGTFLLYYRQPKDAGGISVFGMSRALETLQNFRFDPVFLYRKFKEKKITLGLYKALLALDKLDIKVKAVQDGEFVGPDTPLMIVEGPLWQAQLVETALLQCLDYASGVATRVGALTAITEKPVVDFGTRRAPGEEAATISGLASVCNGAVAVANTNVPLVAEIYGLDGVVDMGTTAHAYTESCLLFDDQGYCLTNPALDELEAYREYIEVFPSTPVVLIDTLKKEVGLHTAARLYHELGLETIGVRDDSDISGASVVMIYDKLKELGVNQFFIVISDDLKPHKCQQIRDEIIRLRGETFYKELALTLGIGTYLARPEPVGMIFKLAEWEENGIKHKVSKASAVETKASFPVVHTYRNDETFEDFNLLPEENMPMGLRRLQKDIDLDDLGLRNLRPYEAGRVPREYLLAKRQLRPEFSKLAAKVRGRIQQALKTAEPVEIYST